MTPSASTQYINPYTGYDGLSSCVVYGDSNLVSRNIKKRVSIFNVSGSLEVGDYKVNFWDASVGIGDNRYSILGNRTTASPYKIDLYSSFALSGGADVGKGYQIRAFCCAIEFAASVSIITVYNSQTSSDNLTF